MDAVDSLAYDVHDIDDALGIGLISLDDLEEVTFWREAAVPVRRDHPEMRGDRFRTAVLRELINWQVGDLLLETERRITGANISSVADVRGCKSALVGCSLGVCGLKEELEKFLTRRVYRHHRVLRMAEKGKRFVKALFSEYLANPELLPPRHLMRWTGAPRGAPAGSLAGKATDSLPRVVGDYLAGMTDRYAQQEYLRLFQPSPEL